MCLTDLEIAALMARERLRRLSLRSQRPSLQPRSPAAGEGAASSSTSTSASVSTTRSTSTQTTTTDAFDHQPGGRREAGK